ncbi:MAG: hypothetical protein K1X35_14455 [Caulobacteraceae bacterium]|nr:hypothetical protein [Caulobacteraceae bacterium]
MSEIDASDKFQKIRRAHAIDAARDAIRKAEAEGQPRPVVFLRAARAASTIVGDNEGGLIAARLLGLVDDQGMPTKPGE